MNSVFKKLAFVAALAVSVVAQDDLVVNTPTNAVVCRPIQITFSGGTPPYFLTIRPGGQPTGAQPLFDFGELQNDDPIRWVVNLPAGTSAGLDLRDSDGRFVQSADFTIITSSDTSCVGQNPSSSVAPSSSGSAPAGSTSSVASSGAPSSSGSAPATSSTPRSTTPAPSPTVSRTTPAPGVSVSRSSTAPGASQTPEDDGAASSNYASAALVGIAGAAAVLLA